ADRLAALFGDAERGAEQGPRGRGPEADDEPRADRPDLVLQPRQAGADVPRTRLRMDAGPAPAFEPETLHGVRHVRQAAVDPRLLHRPVEHAPGRADERMPARVLLVPRLLADEDDAGLDRALAEDRLGGALVELAPPAA